jgi:hypothetical protein
MAYVYLKENRMTKITMIVVLSVCFTVSGAVLAEQEKSAKQLCEEYAKEDGVTEEEFDEYIAQCIANLSSDDEEAGPAESGPGSEIESDSDAAQ